MTAGKARIAAVGVGNRTGKYFTYIQEHPDLAEIVAIAEPDRIRMDNARTLYGLAPEQCYASSDALFDACPDVDGVIIASPDDYHYTQCMRAIACGWNVLLEKPVARTPEECADIARAAEKAGVTVSVCYVLRFHPYYRKLKEIIHSAGLGRVLSVSHINYVGKDRVTHSYVRGFWSKEETSAPILLTKCCHDVDLVFWLTDKGFVPGKVSSYGSLGWFCRENVPAGSSERCINCGVERGCPFSAVDLYRRRREWVSNFPVPNGGSLDDVIENELASGRFGRCVYRCDNDVADRQAIIMELKDGTVVDMSIECFTARDGRKTLVTCAYGTIEADQETIKVSYLTSHADECYDFRGLRYLPFHAKADLEIMSDFIKTITDPSHRPVCTVEDALRSHMACFEAESFRKEHSPSR